VVVVESGKRYYVRVSAVQGFTLINQLLFHRFKVALLVRILLKIRVIHTINAFKNPLLNSNNPNI